MEQEKHRLRLLHDHIARDAPLVSPQVIRRLIQRSKRIGIVPYVPKYQLKALECPYRIICRLLPDRIDIITVMHYRQLLPSDLKG